MTAVHCWWELSLLIDLRNVFILGFFAVVPANLTQLSSGGQQEHTTAVCLDKEDGGSSRITNAMEFAVKRKGLENSVIQ